MKKLLFSLLILSTLCARPATMQWTLQDHVAGALTVRKIYQEPIYYVGVFGTNFVTGDRRTITNGTPGVLWNTNTLTIIVTNLYAGALRTIIPGPYKETILTNTVPDTNGFVLATDYTGVATNLPQYSFAYSQAVSDSRYIRTNLIKNYIYPGSNVTFVTNANGTVTVSSTGGGSGSATNVFFLNSPSITWSTTSSSNVAALAAAVSNDWKNYTLAASNSIMVNTTNFVVGTSNSIAAGVISGSINAATATTASLVSATGNAVTTNDSRLVNLPYVNVGLSPYSNTNTIVVTHFLGGTTNAILNRKTHLVYTNATAGLVFWNGSAIDAAGDLVVTNAAHANLTSDYAAYAITLGAFPTKLTTSAWEDSIGNPLDMQPQWALSTNTFYGAEVNSDLFNPNQVSYFGSNVPSVVDGSGFATDSSGIKVSINTDSEAHKIGLAIINKYPKLTEIYLENQNNGVRQTELVLGAAANGQAFIGTSGLMRIIDPVSAFPHDDLMTWNRTNKFVTSFGTLIITNKSGGTNVSLISSNGSTISGIGITNGNVTIPGTLGVTGATTAGVVTVGSIGGSASGLSNFSANAVSAAFTNANVIINGNLTLGSVASGQKFLYLHDGTDAGRISYGAGSFEFDYGIQAAQFSGGGINLTNLNASSLSSGTVPIERLIFDSYTNGWSMNTPFVLGRTNAMISSGAATGGITGVANLPTEGARFGELTFIATGTITFTNPASMRANDYLTSRTLTNGNVVEIALKVILGVTTNLSIVQFK